MDSKMSDAQKTADLEATEANLEEMLQARLSVTSVRHQGAARTNPTVISSITKSALSTGGTFSSIIDDISQIVERLRATNCFRGVDAYLDRTPEATASVLFTFTEKPLYQLRTGTSVETTGERGASVETAFLWRNVRGKLDTLKASVSWLGNAYAISSDPNMSWDVDYVSPFTFGINSSTFARLGRMDRNHEDDSGYSLRTTGGEVGVELPLGRFSVQSTWRELSCKPQGSALVREEAGHSWKTSLKHEIAFDRRDHPPMPSEGVYACLREEVAAPLLGDVAFAKVEGEAQVHVLLGASGACASVSGRGGVVVGQKGQRVAVQDRFFLGGGNSMRGFKVRGLGPRDGNQAVGGEAFYCVTGMASVPVPTGSLLWQLFNARVHVFGSVGDLGDTSSAAGGLSRMLKSTNITSTPQGLGKLWNKVYESMRISAGLGVALETSIGRVEINFCQTIRAADGDRVKTGVQLAISETFS